MVIIRHTATLLFLIAVTLGCSTPEPANREGFVEITDAVGRKVMVPDSIKSIIALNSGSLRLLAYLNVIDRVVAVEANEHRRKVPYLYAFPQLRKLPQTGTGNLAEPELISAYQPDVIFITYTTAGEAAELQQKTGCPVVAIDYGDFNQNIDRFFATLAFLGEILDRQQRARELTGAITAFISNLNDRTQIHPSEKKVYVGGIAYRGAHGINSTEPMYAPFRFVNADNVAKGLGEVTSSPKAWLENAFIDKEQLIEWDPDMIFIDAAGLQMAEKDLNDLSLSGLLKAKQNNDIYIVLPHNWYTTNFENIICNAFFVGKILYPGSFTDIDIARQSREVYHAFLGTDVFDSVMNQYNAFRRYE